MRFPVFMPLRHELHLGTQSITGYNLWYIFVVVCTYFTVLFVPFDLAFISEAGLCEVSARSGSDIIQVILTAIFLVDIVVNFNVAVWDKTHGKWITDRKAIAQNYVFTSFMFWVDLLSIFPFDFVVGIAFGCDSAYRVIRLVMLTRLIRLLRLYRVWRLVRSLERSNVLSLTMFTIYRNLHLVLFVCHLAACLFFYQTDLSHYSNFRDLTPEQLATMSDELVGDSASWFGVSVADLVEMSLLERYIRSLYWSITTFTTVGYGDFSPITPFGMVFGSIYMLINMGLMAYIVGTITLVVTKGDEAAGLRRSNIKNLQQFIDFNDLGKDPKHRNLCNDMLSHMELYIEYEKIRDVELLDKFPRAIKRKVLKALYMPQLNKAYMFNNDAVRGRNAFLMRILDAADMDIYMPGTDVITAGARVNDFLLLVSGTMTVLEHDEEEPPPKSNPGMGGPTLLSQLSHRPAPRRRSTWNTGQSSVEGRWQATAAQLAAAQREMHKRARRGILHSSSRSTRLRAADVDQEAEAELPFQLEENELDGAATVLLGAGTPIGEVAFFTESEQPTTVQTVSMCRVLALSKDMWRSISEAFPNASAAVVAAVAAQCRLTEHILKVLGKDLPRQLTGDTSSDSSPNIPAPGGPKDPPDIGKAGDGSGAGRLGGGQGPGLDRPPMPRDLDAPVLWSAVQAHAAAAPAAPAGPGPRHHTRSKSSRLSSSRSRPTSGPVSEGLEAGEAGPGGHVAACEELQARAAAAAPPAGQPGEDAVGGLGLHSNPREPGAAGPAAEGNEVTGAREEDLLLPVASGGAAVPGPGAADEAVAQASLTAAGMTHGTVAVAALEAGGAAVAVGAAVQADAAVVLAEVDAAACEPVVLHASAAHEQRSGEEAVPPAAVPAVCAVEHYPCLHSLGEGAAGSVRREEGLEAPVANTPFAALPSDSAPAAAAADRESAGAAGVDKQQLQPEMSKAAMSSCGVMSVAPMLESSDLRELNSHRLPPRSGPEQKEAALNALVEQLEAILHAVPSDWKKTYVREDPLAISFLLQQPRPMSSMSRRSPPDLSKRSTKDISVRGRRFRPFVSRSTQPAPAVGRVSAGPPISDGGAAQLRLFHGDAAQHAAGLVALWRGVQAASRLVFKSVDPNVTDNAGRTRLMRAVVAGDAEYTQKLVDNQTTDLLAKDVTGRNALMLAAANGLEDMVRIFLQRAEEGRGIDVGLRSTDVTGCTAQMLACQGNHRKVVELLHRHGAPLCVGPESPSDRGMTVASSLIAAVRARKTWLLENLLIAAGGPNHADPDGRTPLHVAAYELDRGIVRLLLRHGATVDVKDRWGGTPLSEARRQHDGQTVVTQLQRALEVGPAPELEQQAESSSPPVLMRKRSMSTTSLPMMVQSGMSSPSAVSEVGDDAALQQGGTTHQRAASITQMLAHTSQLQSLPEELPLDGPPPAAAAASALLHE